MRRGKTLSYSIWVHRKPERRHLRGTSETQFYLTVQQAENVINMTSDDHQQVIDELQAVLDDTRATMERFEATGMDEQMPKDYEKLLEILDDAVKQQREHVMVMLLV